MGEDVCMLVYGWNSLDHPKLENTRGDSQSPSGHCALFATSCEGVCLYAGKWDRRRKVDWRQNKEVCVCVCTCVYFPWVCSVVLLGGQLGLNWWNCSRDRERRGDGNEWNQCGVFNTTTNTGQRHKEEVVPLPFKSHVIILSQFSLLGLTLHHRKIRKRCDRVPGEKMSQEVHFHRNLWACKLLHIHSKRLQWLQHSCFKVLLSATTANTALHPKTRGGVNAVAWASSTTSGTRSLVFIDGIFGI